MTTEREFIYEKLYQIHKMTKDNVQKHNNCTKNERCNSTEAVDQLIMGPQLLVQQFRILPNRTNSSLR
jgi:hypothetical protein